MPLWVHEGFAQAQEGRALTPLELEISGTLARGGSWVPLKWLDRHFQQPSSQDDLERAYVESREAVAFLLRRHGVDRFKDFLMRLAKGEGVESAFDDSFHPTRWSRMERGILE